MRKKAFFLLALLLGFSTAHSDVIYQDHYNFGLVKELDVYMLE